jgi:hypothetical protein
MAGSKSRGSTSNGSSPASSSSASDPGTSPSPPIAEKIYSPTPSPSSGWPRAGTTRTATATSDSCRRGRQAHDHRLVPQRPRTDDCLHKRLRPVYRRVRTAKRRCRCFPTWVPIVCGLPSLERAGRAACRCSRRTTSATDVSRSFTGRGRPGRNRPARRPAQALGDGRHLHARPHRRARARLLVAAHLRWIVEFLVREPDGFASLRANENEMSCGESFSGTLIRSAHGKSGLRTVCTCASRTGSARPTKKTSTSGFYPSGASSLSPLSAHVRCCRRWARFCADLPCVHPKGAARAKAAISRGVQVLAGPFASAWLSGAGMVALVRFDAGARNARGVPASMIRRGALESRRRRPSIRLPRAVHYDGSRAR